MKKSSEGPTTKKAVTARSPKRGATRNAPTEAEVRQRAYDIYLQRRGGPGDPVQDWLAAERELDAKR
jgi:hypothetical protein